jgi:DNA-binding response OmpR family regulator
MCNSVWGSIGQQAVQIEGSASQLRVADAPRRLAEGPWPVVVLAAAWCGDDADELVGALADARFEGAIIVLGTTMDGGERIALLGQGADDDSALPYDPGEFVARIAALLCRAHRRVGKPNGLIVRAGSLELDVAHLTISLPGNRRERLTPTEARLLHYMMAHPGRVVGHQELWMHLLGVDDAHMSSNLVGVYMHRVRRKIELRPDRPRLIVTVRGRGYRFDAPDESACAGDAKEGGVV